MDAASGVISAVSLAIQLGDSVYKLIKFLDTVAEASDALRSLREDLTQLRAVVESTQAILKSQEEHRTSPAPYDVVFSALKKCDALVGTLAEYATSFSSLLQKKGVSRPLSVLRIPVHQERIKKIRIELRDAYQALIVSLAINSTNIQ